MHRQVETIRNELITVYTQYEILKAQRFFSQECITLRQDIKTLWAELQTVQSYVLFGH